MNFILNVGTAYMPSAQQILTPRYCVQVPRLCVCVSLPNVEQP